MASSEPRPCILGDSAAGVKTYLAGFDSVTGIPKGRLKHREETNLIDADRGVSEEEELVHAGKEDSPNETDDPSTDGR